IFDKRPQPRLVQQGTVDETLCLRISEHNPALWREGASDGRQSLDISRIEWRQMRDHEGLMDLGTPNDQRANQRDPEATTKIAHQVVYASRISHLVLSQVRQGGGGQRCEDKADRHTGELAETDCVT